MNVGEVVVQTLEQEGVQIVFGLPGNQISPVYDALQDSSIRPILVRHEQGASIMADAYSKFTGKVGVCVSTLGPGATNLMTGIAISMTDKVPVLALTGQQPIELFDRGAQQQMDHVALFEPVTKWSSRLTEPRRAFDIVNRAFTIALTGQPGPVHLDLPYDIQQQEVETPIGRMEKHRPTLPPTASASLIRQAASMLVNARRPVIYAGGGCHYSPGEHAGSLIRQLSEHLSVPVATTFNGQGVIPDAHPLCLGRAGIFAKAYTNELISKADVILAVGCRFTQMSTRDWQIINPESKLIQIDIDPTEIGKNYPVNLAMVGDAKSILKGILQQVRRTTRPRKLEASDWALELNRMRKEWSESARTEAEAESEPLKPQRVLHEIDKFFDGSVVFTHDAGNGRMWASLFVEARGPRMWIQSGTFGPMGYAVPAAIACKLADPEKTVVAICGDGGFLMTAQELATATQHDSPIIVCVLNDGGLGAIRHHQLDLYHRTISVDYENPSFEKLAHAFGCGGYTVEKTDEVLEALSMAAKDCAEGITSVLGFSVDPLQKLPPR
ncbi:MAG: thiamine pyrophosphate-binding protein [Candidatus Geothermarchaeales archaeon]